MCLAVVVVVATTTAATAVGDGSSIINEITTMFKNVFFSREHRAQASSPLIAEIIMHGAVCVCVFLHVKEQKSQKPPPFQRKNTFQHTMNLQLKHF